MKNKLIYLLVSGFVLVTLVSCHDDSKMVYDTSKLPTGAYVRNLTLPSDALTIAAFPTADLTFKAEIVGVNSGSDVTSLDIQVRYIDSNGAVIKDYVALGSITTFAIEPSTSELPRGSISFKGSDVLTKLSITSAALVKGNYIEYYLTLKLKDGRIYTATNFDPNMSNSFYKAGYDFTTQLN